MVTQRKALAVLARKIAEVEAKRQRPIAALLTGSAAWGTISSRSDIDIIFISNESDAVSYRYYMPALTGISVRTEVGRIPLSYLRDILASGYSDEISTGVREQIRNARLLFGDSRLAGRLIEEFAELKPRKRLLGEYLFKAREALRKAREALSHGSRVSTMLELDEVSKNLWRLVLVSKHRTGVQKDKHELRAARSQLAESELKAYLRSKRMAGCDRQQAAKTVLAAREAISKTLDVMGIDVKILGDPEV
jgi:predicted nucleotidyltransferase